MLFAHFFILPATLPSPAHTLKISGMTLPDPDDTVALQTLLTELKVEHHDLDASIARLEENPPPDELVLRRLKKRKLQLKDRIASIERQIGPDLLA
jgi:hypothetical protein